MMTSLTMMSFSLVFFTVWIILVAPLHATSAPAMRVSGSGEERLPCDDENGECELNHPTKPATGRTSREELAVHNKAPDSQTGASTETENEEQEAEEGREEEESFVRKPRFHGDSYMMLPRLPSTARASLELSITFKASSGDGLLLYSGRRDGKDFLSLALRNSHVEFRFNNGGDTAILTTKQNITLDKWHKVVAFRDQRDGYLMLDHGELVTQSTQGPQYLMDLETELYLGGVPRMRIITASVKYDRGFSGCIKDMVINGRKMVLSEYAGEALQSHNIGTCDSRLHAAACNCRHQAPCQYTDTGELKCACPLGTYGLRCEHKLKLLMPSFEGRSYLSYPSLGLSAVKSFVISLVLKPRSDTGLILFNGQRTDGKGDFISLSLREGRVEFMFDCGSGPAIIRSKTTIIMNQWQTIKISRDGRTASLIVNGGRPVVGTSPGRLNLISLKEELQLGGMRDYRHQPAVVGMRVGFKGCIQQVSINSKTLSLPSAHSGVNIVNCNHLCVTHSLCLNGGACHAIMDHYTCRCAVGYTGIMCERARRVSTPSFTGDGYLQITDEKILNSVSGFNTKIELKFRTSERNGLILLAKQKYADNGDHISIRLVHGKVEARYDLGTGVETVIMSKTSVDDGRWHSIKFVRKTWSAYLKVDKEVEVNAAKNSRFHQLNSDMLFIGGTPMTDVRHPSTGLDGCIKDLSISDYVVNFASDVSAGANVRQCTEYYD